VTMNCVLAGVAIANNIFRIVIEDPNS
jgi:hypothetical protein